MPRNLREVMAKQKAREEGERRASQKRAQQEEGERQLVGLREEAREHELIEQARPYFNAVCMPILEQVAEYLGIPLANTEGFWGKKITEFEVNEGTDARYGNDVVSGSKREWTTYGKMEGTLSFDFNKSKDYLCKIFQISAESDGTIVFDSQHGPRPEVSSRSWDTRNYYDAGNAEHMEMLWEAVANVLRFSDYKKRYPKVDNSNTYNGSTGNYRCPGDQMCGE